MGTCASKKKKKLAKPPIMAIPPELPGEDNNSIPVTNSLETAEENGGGPEKTSSSSSPTKISSELLTAENIATPVKSRWSFSSSKKSFGSSSKDETFFDSHQWLQSDCEDDFFSVNGDFTPSLGNTPKCSFSEKLPRFQNPLFKEEKPRVSFSNSPAPRRKKLAELFRDSIREEREKNLEDFLENHSENSSSSNSGELKPIEDSLKEKKNHKSLNYYYGCLPRLSSFKGSLVERRKKNKKIPVK